MKNDKYKILVLSNLEEKSTQILNYAAKLANEINGHLEFLHVKEATEVSHSVDALSAINAISEIRNQTERRIKDLVSPISKENTIDIKTSFAYGHVKKEIKNYIDTLQPHMIILGEKKKKRLNLFGDNITRFVEKNYKGVLLIATDNNLLDSNGRVSLDNLGLKNNIVNYNVEVKDKSIA